MSTTQCFNPDFETSFRGTPRQSNKSISQLQWIADSNHPGNLLAQAAMHAAQLRLLLERYLRCGPSPGDASQLRLLSCGLRGLTVWLEQRGKNIDGSDAK